MTPQQYRKLQTNLNFKRSEIFTLAFILMNTTLIFSFVKIAAGADFFSPIHLVSQIVLAVLCFQNFAMLHEAGHGNCSKHSLINQIFGHYCSLFCWMPFFCWKYIHQEHHLWTGNLDKDPTFARIKSLQSIRKHDLVLNIIWRYWIPALAIIQHIVLYTYPIVLFKKTTNSSRKKLHSSMFSVSFLLASYGPLIYFIGVPILAHCFGLTLFFYMLLTELINFPHHLKTKMHLGEKKLPPWEQLNVTRTCYFPKLISEILALNFNFHCEHHLFPGLPWYRLRGLRNRLNSMDLNDYQQSMGFAWSLKWRKHPMTEVFKIELAPEFSSASETTSIDNAA